MRKLFLFQCPNCGAKDYFDKSEVPCGDPQRNVSYCDHCNFLTEYVRTVSNSHTPNRSEQAAEKSYDSFRAIMDWEQGELDEEGVITLFQYLIDTDMAWRLQGMYGRQAVALIEAGYCHPKEGA